MMMSRSTTIRPASRDGASSRSTYSAISTFSWCATSPRVFAEANASGHLTNAANYLAIVGPANDEGSQRRAGFYAERMVLTATLRGLGTLWVAGSWDKAGGQEALPRHLWPGAVSRCGGSGIRRIIWIIGRNPEELCEAQRTHRATKTYEQFTAT